MSAYPSTETVLRVWNEDKGEWWYTLARLGEHSTSEVYKVITVKNDREFETLCAEITELNDQG